MRYEGPSHTCLPTEFKVSKDYKKSTLLRLYKVCSSDLYIRVCFAFWWVVTYVDINKFSKSIFFIIVRLRV